jgi:regulator of protease activity HflC (stomatin/prohibitin superfamily)
VARAARGRSFKLRAIRGTIVAAILLTSVAAGLVFIRPEERGVVISAVAPGGYHPAALTPGLHWVIPFFENVVIYPISRQTYTMSIAPSEGTVQGDDSVEARTSDGQIVRIDASVIYAIDLDRVVQVHIEWQSRYSSDLVRPIARGLIRSAASQYGVEEIVTSERDALTDRITADLATSLEENGINLIEFILRNITFSEEYSASVEQKQIAEQLAQQAALPSSKGGRRRSRHGGWLRSGRGHDRRAGGRRPPDRGRSRAQALEMIAAALAEIPAHLQSSRSARIQVMLVPSNAHLLPLPLVIVTPAVTGRHAIPAATCHATVLWWRRMKGGDADERGGADERRAGEHDRAHTGRARNGCSCPRGDAPPHDGRIGVDRDLGDPEGPLPIRCLPGPSSRCLPDRDGGGGAPGRRLLHVFDLRVSAVVAGWRPLYRRGEPAVVPTDVDSLCLDRAVGIDMGRPGRIQPLRSDQHAPRQGLPVLLRRAPVGSYGGR